jgi:hypothetical protein
MDVEAQQQLRLRLRPLAGPAAVLSVAASTSIADFLRCLRAREEGPVPQSYVFGFPPVPLPEDSTEPLSSVLRTNDAVTAVGPPPAPPPAAPAAAVGKGKGKKRARVEEESDEEGAHAGAISARPSRAAKTAAGPKMEEQLRQDAAAAGATPHRGKATVASPGRVGGLRAPGSAFSPARTPTTRIVGSGHSLGPGAGAGAVGALAQLHTERLAHRPEARAAASAAALAVARRAKRRVRTRVNLPSNQEDLMVALVKSGRGSGMRAGGDPALAFLRDGAQAALSGQCKMATAVARVSAALSGQYEITPAEDGGKVLGTGAAARLTLQVRFKAVGERTWQEEVVDVFPASTLPAFLRVIGGEVDTRSLLRPEALAMRPDVFWTVVALGGVKMRAAQAGAGAGAGTGAAAADSWQTPRYIAPGYVIDVTCACEALQPAGVDWAALRDDKRTRTQTAKAQAAALEHAAARMEAEARRRKRLGLPSAEAEQQPVQLAGAVDAAEALHDDEEGGTYMAAGAAGGDVAKQAGGVKYWSVEPSIMAIDAACVTAAVLLRQPGGALLQAVSAGRSRRSAPGPGAACTRAASALSRLAVALALHLTADVDAVLAAVDARSSADLVRAVVGDDMPVEDHREGAESRTFLCCKCSRARILWSDEADFGVIEENEAWTCECSGIASLTARGGCGAPDDDVVRVLLTEKGSRCLAHIGLASLERIASGWLRDDDHALSSGAEAPLPAPLVAATAGICTGRSQPVASAHFTVQEWRDALSTRLPDPAILLAAAAAPGSQPLPAPSGLLLDHILSIRGVQMDELMPIRHRRAMDCKLQGSALTLAAALALVLDPGHAPIAPILEADTDAAFELLCSPLGYVVSARLALHWQNAAAFDVLDELLAATCIRPPFDALAAAVGHASTGSAAQAGAGAAPDPRVAALLAEATVAGAGGEGTRGWCEGLLEDLADRARGLLSGLGVDTPADLARYAGVAESLHGVLLKSADTIAAASVGAEAEAEDKEGKEARGQCALVSRWLAMSDVQAWCAAAAILCGEEPWVASKVSAA